MPNLSRTSQRVALALALCITGAASALAVDAYVPPGDRGNASSNASGEAPGVHRAVRTDFRAPSIESAGVGSSKQPVAPATRTVPLSSKPLPPAEGDAAPKASGWSTLLSALGSLVVVLGLFLAVVWFLRRTGPKSMTVLPSEVFEVLGHSPLAARQQAQLVRCGGKLLLLSVTAAGAETLAEIAEPAEVERLVGLCQQARPNSATASFRNLLAQFAGEGRQEAATAPRRERTGLARFTRSRTEAADA